MKTTWLDSRKDDIRSAESESESTESAALEQARKLQDAQAEKLTNLKAQDKMTR